MAYRYRYAKRSVQRDTCLNLLLSNAYRRRVASDRRAVDIGESCKSESVVIADIIECQARLAAFGPKRQPAFVIGAASTSSATGRARSRCRIHVVGVAICERFELDFFQQRFRRGEHLPADLRIDALLRRQVEDREDASYADAHDDHEDDQFD